MEHKRKKLINVLVLGFSFMLIFTAFQTCGNVQETVLSSRNATSNENGYTSQSIIYGVFSVSSITASSVVALLGPRLSMVIGGAIYSLYVAMFIEPMTWSFYTSSVSIGAAAAVLWTAQGTCLTLNSDSTTMARNTGIFWALLQCSFLLGNLHVYISWQGKTHILDSDRRVLFIVLTIICASGALLLLIIRRIPNTTGGPSLEGSILVDKPAWRTLVDRVQDTDPVVERYLKFKRGLDDALLPYKELHRNVGQSVRNSVRLFFTRHMLLLSVCIAYTGLQLTFFTGVYGTCLGATNHLANAKSLIGLSGILIGIGEITGGALFGVVSQWLKRCRTRLNHSAVVVLGLLTHLTAFVLVFLNLPPEAPIAGGIGTDKLSYLHPSVAVALLCSFLLGFGDSCYNTQLYNVLGNCYASDSAPAFAIFKFVQSIMASIAFFYSNYLFLQWQLLILGVVAILGAMSFILAETFAAHLEPLTAVMFTN
uniref:UNC93-like protein MFSD11 n=1 Tax=Myxine glutinosa TaxID=7769 RepID=UPI00358FFD83